ncbi:MAG: sigma-54-dependent Fis family transcriptional regulator [Pirellulales bacterium]|nr:sigma-54-dependent Fis family transcriptional regulator [Pirellulales bacterium]
MAGETRREPVPEAIASLEKHQQLAPLAAELLWRANHTDDADAFLDGALAIAATAVGGDYLALVAPRASQWSVVGQLGKSRALPIELLAEAIDSETVQADDAWAVAPMHRHAVSAELLVVHHPSGKSQIETARLFVRAIGPVLGQCLTVIRDRYAQGRRRDRRLHRLETIVRIAQQWNQRHEVEPLLADMAQAATQLLEADRASIFLWDRETKTLVGRPALGVEGGELRVPDDAGVVGQVIRSGRASRVDATAEPDAINRRVDAQLDYETKTVLCVPLDNAAGQRLGAFELLNKHAGSFTDEDEAALVELAGWAAIALENAQDYEQLLSANRRIAQQAADEIRMIGQSPAMQSLRSVVGRVADTDLAVLILGENGTGKEVVARSIHYQSRRRERPFIAVNCAAIPDTLAESELFGHEKGAFTDAQERRLGKFELAADGTLFLDEIGDLSLGGQAKLLRVLEERLLVRVGGSTPIHTEARVVAATNQNLADMVRQKRFREDLYFRLNVVTLDIPPLRERGDDVMLLAADFLADFCRKARRKPPKFSAAAERRLREHPWPGNVRELRNLMERLAYLSTDQRIEAEELAFILSPRPMAEGPGAAIDENQPLGEATNQFQIDFIHRAIKRSGGNVSRAAARLGLHRSNLYRKMRQLGMDTEIEE